jgi:Fe-S cluster assembly protein SufD
MEETIIKNQIIDIERSVLNTVNNHAKAQLDQMQWPTTRDEDWKYTRTGRITKESWVITPIPSNAPWESLQIADLDVYTVVFINGQLHKEASNLPTLEGITIDTHKSTEQTPSNFGHYFEALQAAYCTSHLRVVIANKTQLDRPIHFIHFNDGQKALSQPTIEIEVGTFAKASFIESFGSNSTEQSFGNRKLSIQVGENAHVAFDKIQDMHDGDFLMNQDQIHIAKSAQFTINTLTIDGGWTRNQLTISLDGENIEASLNGCYLPRRNQLVDNHTKVDHRFAHCNSHELYKGLLNDSATGVFNGKVHVHLDAQKTNAYQQNANILLSDEAQMNSKPELEIYADDVKCSHGSTTGQLDDEAMFYLQSRGLSPDNARRLLTTAFINDVLNHVENEAIRAHVIQRLEQEGLLYH